jgi:cell division protein FtsL
MIWILFALFCAAVLVVVYACCRMSGMSDEEVQMYADESARQADYEYLIKQRSELTKQL